MLCMVDASEAFDRVNLLTLFKYKSTEHNLVELTRMATFHPKLL